MPLFHHMKIGRGTAFLAKLICEHPVLADQCRRCYLTGVSKGVESTFDFFADVKDEDDQALTPELLELFDVWKDEGGLIPNAACPGLFKMSKQAWSFIPGRYGLTEYKFLGKKWYSRKEVEALHKTKRSRGKKGADTAQMVRDCLEDVRRD